MNVIEENIAESNLDVKTQLEVLEQTEARVNQQILRSEIFDYSSVNTSCLIMTDDCIQEGDKSNFIVQDGFDSSVTNMKISTVESTGVFNLSASNKPVLSGEIDTGNVGMGGENIDVGGEEWCTTEDIFKAVVEKTEREGMSWTKGGKSAWLPFTTSGLLTMIPALPTSTNIFSSTSTLPIIRWLPLLFIARITFCLNNQHVFCLSPSLRLNSVLAIPFLFVLT